MDDAEVPTLGGDYTAVDCRAVKATELAGKREATADYPVELTAALPDGWQPGTSLKLEAYRSFIEVMPPRWAKPGMMLRYRLGPAPDFEVAVPPGAPAGASVRFMRPDGSYAAAKVPDGLLAGDTFEVAPTALMVRVPGDAFPGQQLVFRAPDNPSGEWFCAEVPREAMPGGYFAARLP